VGFNGRTKGYASRGGHKTARIRKADHVERDFCACGNTKFLNQYVCSTCEKSMETSLSATPLLLTDEPEVRKNGKACSTCDHVASCSGLVVRDLPVMCEIWDELDLFVLAKNGRS